MYSLVYNFYFYLKRLEKLKGSTPATKKLSDYCDAFFNVFLRRFYEHHPSDSIGTTTEKRDQKIVVSLTSFPKRIDTVWLTIETLFHQSVKPDEIILWLAESQFNGIDSLPNSLLRMQKRGLTIRFCEDFRSHKKYYFALKEHPEDLVILADDDMFYPRDTIKNLMQLHERYPKDICCITAQVIDPEFTAVPSLWRNPRVDEHSWQHSDRLQAYTGSGTLIPPCALPQEVFDEEMFQKLCPYADDLWLTFMAYWQGTRFSTLQKWRAFPISIYGTAEGSLYYVNGEQKQNDVQWQNLLDEYGVPEYVE